MADVARDGYWFVLRDFRPVGWRDSRGGSKTLSETTASPGTLPGPARRSP